MAELTLEFRRRYALLRACQQVHGYEPVPDRKLAPVHHGIGLQALAVMAALALEAFLVPLPVVQNASASGTDYPMSLPVLS